MKKTTIATIASLLAAITVSATSVVPVFAESPTASANIGIGAIGLKKTDNVQVSLNASQAKGDAAITARITALNSLQTRINAMVKVSAGQKATLTASIQAVLQSMNALKAKIDVDTDSATLKTDIASITKDNRIYALIIPQGRVEASADREATIVSLMQTLGTKLQARIAADQSAGKDVTAMQSAYSDFQAKIADANTQSNNAITIVAALQPDQGNQSVLQANNAALKQALADLKTGESDLKAARKDAGTIATDLKNLNVSTKTSLKASGTVKNK